MASAALMANDDDILIFCPSDHFIKDDESYINTVSKAVTAVEKDSIVALGANPTFPSAAYGYMKVESDINCDYYYTVKKFIEKPDIKNATQLISSKNVFWNAGSFMAYPKTILTH